MRPTSFLHVAICNFSKKKNIRKSKLTVSFTNSYIVTSVNIIAPRRTRVFGTFQSFVAFSKHIPTSTARFVYLASTPITAT